MPRQPDLFNSSVQQILNAAQKIAYRKQHDELTTDHLLLAMTQIQETDAYHALRDVDIIESKLGRFLSSLHPNGDAHPLRYDGLRVSDTVQTVFQLSYVQATVRGDDYIGSGHLLIGMMRVQSKTVAAVLDHFALEPKQVIKAAEHYLDNPIEATRHRIPVALDPDVAAAGCISQLSRLVTALSDALGAWLASSSQTTQDDKRKRQQDD